MAVTNGPREGVRVNMQGALTKTAVGGAIVIVVGAGVATAVVRTGDSSSQTTAVAAAAPAASAAPTAPAESGLAAETNQRELAREQAFLRTAATTRTSPTASPTATGAPTGAAATRAQAPITYVVRPGDTLSTIAAWFHLHGYGALYEANKAVLGANPNLIFPGQTITLSHGTMTVG
jgi:nucleoid-associated protein YgaU